ncbi:MAG: NAD(P)H-dependent oxidoreductase [Verrucomicrobiales bacterium]|nr:NAD(P)H-dependent oxidoreductase [Verrucomicrobiales bacterium]
MPILTTSEVVQQLRWRYAVRRFDPARRISDTAWSDLESALVLTPSSFGLQPWKFFVLTDASLRERLLPLAWGQRQVVEASHLVVLGVRRVVDEAYVDDYITSTAASRGISVDSLSGLRQSLVRFLAGLDETSTREWAVRQIYIALGNFMTAAAMAGIDTCPMEGFQPDKVDALLDLPRRGFSACLLCPAGYRADSDKYASTPKVRWPKDRVVERLS